MSTEAIKEKYLEELEKKNKELWKMIHEIAEETRSAVRTAA
jgi:hypothetical protein